MAKANSDCKKIVSYLKIVSNHVSVSKDRIGVSQSDVSSSCVPKIHENGVPFLCHTKTSDKYVAVKMTVSRDNN
eukprot:scaffold80931_cov73-Cyclotella_meneghiniana.AAC.1